MEFLICSHFQNRIVYDKAQSWSHLSSVSGEVESE